MNRIEMAYQNELYYKKKYENDKFKEFQEVIFAFRMRHQKGMMQCNAGYSMQDETMDGPICHTKKFVVLKCFEPGNKYHITLFLKSSLRGQRKIWIEEIQDCR